LNRKDPRFHIFKGTEADILPDGRLDYDDATLETFDFVIAAVHSHFAMSKDDMTARIMKALENRHTTILAHPTGRLLLAREPYALDLERIIDFAASRGKVIASLQVRQEAGRADRHQPGCAPSGGPGRHPLRRQHREKGLARSAGHHQLHGTGGDAGISREKEGSRSEDRGPRNKIEILDPRAFYFIDRAKTIPRMSQRGMEMMRAQVIPWRCRSLVLRFFSRRALSILSLISSILKGLVI
jgi:hypothetical protein